MTNTALKNREIESRERIADKDRELEERKFKFQKGKDIAKLVTDTLVGFSPFKLLSKSPDTKYRTVGGRRGGQMALKINDPEYFKQYLTDLDKFTNVTTWTRLGYDTYGGNYKGSVSIANDTFTDVVNMPMPGLVAFHWVPSLGPTSAGANDLSTTPANQILMRTKEQVLKSNSRSNVPYEASDLGLNFFASGSIIGMICEYHRMLLVAQTYRGDNAYYARTYLKALGADPSEWMNHLAQARQYLLLLQKRFNSSVVAPSDLSYYKRVIYYSTMWVKDCESTPAQVYTAVADRVWKLTADGSGLVGAAPDRSSPQAFYEFISGLIQVIAENPDYVSMYADLRSAFTDNLFSFNEGFDQDMTIEENYTAAAIEQIANIHTLPVFWGDDEVESAGVVEASLNVAQDSSGYLYQGTTLSAQGLRFRYPTVSNGLRQFINGYYKRDKLINMHKDEITGDDILDVTRFMYVGEASDIKSGDDITAAELRITDSDMFVMTHVVITEKVLTDTAGYLAYVSGTVHYANLLADSFQEGFNGLMSLVTFDWAPLAQLYTPLNGGVVGLSTVGEAQHLFSIGLDNVKKLNVACVLSELYISTSTFKR